MRIEIIFTLGIFAIFGQSAFGQSIEIEEYQFEQIDSLMAVEERPVAVFIHTAWCRYCKNMEQNTFKNEAIVNILNKEFYFVSFDAEQKEAVTFRGYTFAFKPRGRNFGVHALAEALGSIDGQLNYPTFVILNEAYEIVFQYDAFLSAKALTKVLKEVRESTN